jgi:hypothetical protein
LLSIPTVQLNGSRAGIPPVLASHLKFDKFVCTLRPFLSLHARLLLCEMFSRFSFFAFNYVYEYKKKGLKRLLAFRTQTDKKEVVDGKRKGERKSNNSKLD